MKKVKNGKMYNTEKMETIAERDHYNYKNNYSGTTSLLRASDDTYWLHTSANGQDLYLQNDFNFCDDPISELENMDMTDDQHARAIELNLITEV
jgi:hypothetical protein